MPPGESPGEKGQHGPLIVLERAHRVRRNGLYQNGQYVGLQSHMFTRFKPIHVYTHISTFMIYPYIINMYLYYSNYSYVQYSFV